MRITITTSKRKTTGRRPKTRPVAGLVSDIVDGGGSVCKPTTGRDVGDDVGSILAALTGVTVGGIVATAVGNGTTGPSGASRLA